MIVNTVYAKALSILDHPQLSARPKQCVLHIAQPVRIIMARHVCSISRRICLVIRIQQYVRQLLFALQRFGDFTKALEYQKNDKQYLIKVKDRIEKDGVYRIQQQFDFEKMKNEMNEKVIVRQRIILLMSFVVIFVFVALVMLQRRLAKIHKQEIATKERTLFYVRQYTELLTKQGKTMQKLAIVIDNKEDKALLENLRATVFGRKDPWDALIEVFDILHPNERERIAHQYANLNDMELKDIILSYFNVSRQDEALLLKTGIHSVDKIRISVKRKKQQISEKQ